MKVTVLSNSSDISCAGIGPMIGTISSKSCNDWLMSLELLEHVLGHTVVEQHIRSTRWHFNERCGFQGQSEFWAGPGSLEEAYLTVESLARSHVEADADTLVAGRYCGFLL